MKQNGKPPKRKITKLETYSATYKRFCMNQYEEILNQLPDLSSPKDDKVTFEQCTQVHPTFDENAPETWILFLSQRPDIVGDERQSILRIISRLYANESVALEPALKWKSA